MTFIIIIRIAALRSSGVSLRGAITTPLLRLPAPSTAARTRLCYNLGMGKLDEVKEILNTLRIAMSIAFGVLVVLIGSLVKRFDAQNIDMLFWSGVVFAIFIVVVIALIVLNIAKKTKEIKDL